MKNTINKEKIKVTMYFKNKYVSAIYDKENITFYVMDIMKIFRDFKFDKIEFEKLKGE